MQRKSISLETESYKGVRDFYPEDQFIQNYIFKTWKKAVRSFGYEEYNASIIEPSELYKAKSGQEIVNDQTYTFTDRGEREVTLRPEMTPTIARMVAKRRRELGFPLRVFSIPNVFRYERPQRGRLREHWQLNVDLFGSTHIESDIEQIELASHIMTSFGAKQSDYTIKLSSRKLLNSLFADWYDLNEEKSHSIKKLIDKKHKIPEDEFYAEAEKVIGKPFEFLNWQDNSNSTLQSALSIPTIKEAYDEINLVINTLKNRGISNVEFDQTLVRGFDYYTGIIFEVFDNHPENNRSLFGGGRYDELLSLFGSDQVPACGFGMGDVTIADFLEIRGLMPKYKPATNIMICPVGDLEGQLLEFCNTTSHELRLKGLGVAINYSERNIGDQIKSAEKLKIPYVAIIGNDETESKTYKVKNLETGKELNIEEVLKEIEDGKLTK